MPLYDVKCTKNCGRQEAFAPLSQADSIKCPECGAPAIKLISPVMTVGAVFDKKIEFGQIGKKFETNAEFREYKKKHPEATFVNKNSKVWRDHYDQVRNHCDAKSKKQGFSDHEDRIKHLRKQKAERLRQSN